MDAALLFARLLLAAVFVVAGVAKLADREGSRRAVADFGVPVALAAPLGILLPLAELAVAATLIPTSTAFWALLELWCSCSYSLPASAPTWRAAAGPIVTASANSTPPRQAGLRSHATGCSPP